MFKKYGHAFLPSVPLLSPPLSTRTSSFPCSSPQRHPHDPFTTPRHTSTPHRHPHLSPPRPPLSPLHRRSSLITTCATSSGTGAASDAATSASSTLSWGVGKSAGDTLVDVIPEAAKRACMSFRVRQVSINMVLVFVSSTFESNRKDELRRVIPTVKRTLAMLQVLSPDTVFFGCTTGDDISPNPNSDGVNADSKVSATIAVAHLPAEAKIDVTHFAKRDDFSLDWRQSQWLEKLNFPTSSTTTDNLNKENDNDDNNNSSSSSSSGSNNNTNDAFQFVLYTPEFIDATYDLLKGLDFALPGTRKLGCAAGKVNPLHETQLFYSEVDTSKSINSEKDPMCQGALVITVHTQNTFTVDVSVAQGARPLGPLMEVLEVRDEGNEITVVKEVNTATETRAAPMQLLDMWVKTDIVSLDDGRLAAKYLLMGTEVETLYFNFPPPSKETTTTEQSKKSEDKSSSSSSPPLPSPAEQDPVMLSRKVTGFNESRKSIGVEGDPVRLGTRVQFQIRDEQGATQELARLVDRLSLENSVRAADGLTLMGAIVLADAERGEALYGSDNADMDYRAYKERFMVPVAVVTSQGQIGPLPSGGLLMPGVGDSFMLSASTVYVSIYGQTGVPVTAEDSG